jgi:thiol-disulfide isomerase/thioredoxin/ribosomal protein S9
MRNLFLSLAIVACALTGFRAGDGFSITGKITGTATKVHLVVMNEGKRDTIATAPVTDGAFTIEGKVERLQPANLFIEGVNAPLVLYLENEAYEITQDASGITITGGGETQNIASRFTTLQRDLAAKVKELEQEFTAANKDKNSARMAEIQKEYQESHAAAQTAERDLVAANPGSLASLSNVAAFARRAAYEPLKERFDLLNDAMKETPAGKTVAERLAKLEAVSVGQIAPDFELDTPDGGKITLHGVQAKVKLIDFWASWCGPCRGENPNVVAMYQEYHPKGLEIVGVSLDRDKEAWIKAIADDGLTWKHGSDLQYWQAAPAKLYVVNAIPHTVLLDENNRIIAKDLRGDALKAKIAELLD